jgi:DNA replication and repair protein RecF
VHLYKINIKNVRNINELAASSFSRWNYFFGQNGSGKTSFLEAIHILGSGKSFRTHLSARVIQHGSPGFMVSAQGAASYTPRLSIGVARKRQGTVEVRINESVETRLATLVELLPIQCIEPSSHAFLLGAPKIRRQFLNWGVFHVKPEFISVWTRFQRVLKQRNAALQQQASKESVSIWDREFLSAAQEIDSLRKAYLDDFSALFNALIAPVLFAEALHLTYKSGWGREIQPEAALSHSFSRDLAMGATQVGPHRADLLLTLRDQPAQEILSRGQQKLLVYLLKITQGLLLQSQTKKCAIYLLDDLGAELDYPHRQIIWQLLRDLKCQTFITGLAPDLLDEMRQYTEDIAAFHVEHGQITPFSDLLSL